LTARSYAKIVHVLLGHSGCGRGAQCAGLLTHHPHLLRPPAQPLPWWTPNHYPQTL